MGEHQDISLHKALRVALVIGAVIGGLFLAYRMSYYVAPFIIAFVISSLLEPLIKFLEKKMKIPRRIASPITLLIFILFFGLLVVLVILRLIAEIKDISKILPEFFSVLYDTTGNLIDKATEIYDWFPKDVASNIENIIGNLANSLMSVVNSVVNTLVKGAYTTAISIPEALLFILITIIATYFLTSDREKIFNYFKAQFPESWVSGAVSIKNDMFSALFGYLKALLILLCITFTELFIGFSIIRVRYSLLLAFMISIVDILPILGTGTILIPWSIFEFLTGNIRMGVSIILLYGIVMIVRQMIEPKIVGQQIGIYPLLTLISMYAGLKLIGVTGLILGPITVLLLKNILTGVFKNRPIKEIIKK